MTQVTRKPGRGGSGRGERSLRELCLGTHRPQAGPWGLGLASPAALGASQGDVLPSYVLGVIKPRDSHGLLADY